MDFYYVSDEYINYLKQIDSKVPNNYQGTRPYVGVVVDISGTKYYAPLTSPKPKHQKMKNDKDFRRLDGGKLGAINFNNMIPVPDSEITLINIAQEPDEKYRRLLQNQYAFVQRDKETIERDFPMSGDIPKEVVEDGKTYKRVYNASFIVPYVFSHPFKFDYSKSPSRRQHIF